tara:strand:- start:596 stop:697 length:102 start_codon:yes stop_codon:yes gene_type:complete
VQSEEFRHEPKDKMGAKSDIEKIGGEFAQKIAI